MHVSLDSALGRQRRLNSVGESVLQIAPSAAAAYSLRSLTGGDPKVVRVRRGSDNHEQDFTASEVSSGALTSFVNAQVVAPLDIQALSATGRDGDFLIAKAAYSLRSLGTRQATLAATGDTVARANGKYVCQVRRSSDDALKSFTATEITDGTLLAFVTEAQVGWNIQATFNDSTATITSASSTATTSTVSFTGSGVTRVLPKSNYVLAQAGDQVVFNMSVSGLDSAMTFRMRKANSNTTVGTATVDNGDNQDVTMNLTASSGYTGGYPHFTADAGSGEATVTINSVTVTGKTGFVKTWYDQSVTTQAGDTATGNHAVQATAAEQPKVVNAGSLLNELDFDGTDDSLAIDFGANLSQANSFFMVHQSDSLSSSANEFFDITTFSSGADRTLLDQSGSNYRMLGASSADTGVAVTTDKSLIFALYNGASSLFAKNGTATSALNAGTSGINQNSSLGASSSGTRLYNGKIQEFIIYNSNQTDNRTAIEANLGEAYSIDLPSGVDPGFDQVDGFVETWYDQSGNGRDSTNTTAVQQPIIVEAGVFQDGLKFTHTDTTNGKRLFVPVTSANLDPFTLVYVGKVTASDASINNLLGGVRGVTNFAAGTIGLCIKSSDGSISVVNEVTTSERVIKTNTSLNTTLNEDFVAFASYEDAEAGPDITISVDGNADASFDFPSGFILSSSKNIGIMNATNNANVYRTQESPTGICREILVYVTNEAAKRVALETNINNQYNLF